MKAKTMRLTNQCSYCGCNVTYRSIESYEAAKNSVDGFMHVLCKKAKKEEV